MNDHFTKELLDSLGGQVGEKLAGKNVVTHDQAISSLSPVILGSLQRKRAEFGEGGLEELRANAGITESDAEGIGAILDRDGDGSILDDIAGLVLGSDQNSGKRGGILAWLLSLCTGRK